MAGAKLRRIILKYTEPTHSPSNNLIFIIKFAKKGPAVGVNCLPANEVRDKRVLESLFKAWKIPKATWNLGSDDKDFYWGQKLSRLPTTLEGFSCFAPFEKNGNPVVIKNFTHCGMRFNDNFEFIERQIIISDNMRLMKFHIPEQMNRL